VPETRDLARLAREQGALAASAFGAGFGGSVWSLVPRAEAAQLIQRWSGAYVAQYPVRESTCDFFATGAGPCAFPILS